MTDDNNHLKPAKKPENASIILAEEIRFGIEVSEPPPKVVLLDCESITDVDATALITLEELNGELEREGIDLRLVRVRSHVLELMRSTELEEKIGAANIYASVQDGVDAYLTEHSRKPEMMK